MGLGFVILVVYLSLVSSPPDLDVPQAFDMGHVLAYFWLMIWFAQIYRANGQRWALAAAFCALGVGLEFVQGMTGYRMFEYSDMALNVLGVGAGLALAQTAVQNGLSALERVMVD